MALQLEKSTKKHLMILGDIFLQPNKSTKNHFWAIIPDVFETIALLFLKDAVVLHTDSNIYGIYMIHISMSSKPDHLCL